MRDTPIPSPRSGAVYRPDIDGLRAVAVVLVLAFHAFPALVPGGFVGVDVFLVISGYLISSNVLGEWDDGSHGAWRFYRRRIRRIFPALTVVLAASLILGWVVLLPGEYRQLGKHVVGGALFVPNVFLYGEAGYFDAASETKPLLHLWTLGVEGQFYLVWPLVLSFVLGRRWPVLPLVVLSMLVSFAWNVVEVGRDPAAAYFLPFSRLWELILGGLLACWERRHPAGIGTRGLPVGLVGVGLVGVAAVLLDPAKPFPGWWGLLPAVGAAATIAAGPGAWVNRALLARPWAVGVGLISYPLYLWHWPLLTFLRISTDGVPSTAALGAALAFSVILAWATYRFIERPLKAKRTGWGGNPMLTGALALCAVLGAGVWISGGVPARMPRIAAYDAFFANNRYNETHDLVRYDRQDCNFFDLDTNTTKADIAPACTTPQSPKMLFVWGDSHSQHLLYGLTRTLEPDVSVLSVSASGCTPSQFPVPDDPIDTCNSANRFALKRIAALKPQVVLLAEEGHHQDNDFASLIAHLHGLGVPHVILLGPVPHWKPFLYQVVERKFQGNPPPRTWTNVDPEALETDRILHRRFDGSPEVTFISLIDHLCDADGCLVYTGDDPMEGLTSYDYGHFTLPTSDYVARTVLAPSIKAIFADRR